MVEVPGIGRKWSLVFGAIIQGVAMALYTQATTIRASVGLNALEYIAQSFFNAVLYGFTPEVFPAPIRGVRIFSFLVSQIHLCLSVWWGWC